VDAFALGIRNGAGTLNDSVLYISALHSCGGETTSVSQELSGPTATVTGPDCTGAVDVTVDNSASDLAWTPYVYLGSGVRTARPVVAAHTQTVLRLDLGNARSSLLGLEFRTTRPDTHWPDEYTDGGTYGLTLPTAAARCDAMARGAFAAVTPTRLVDTRVGTGARKAAVAAGGRLVVQATGQAGIPAGAAAAVVNLIVTAAQRGGFLQAWSATDGPSTGSVLNFAAAHTTANTTVVPLDIHGRFSVRNASAGSLQLLADVSGYVLGGPAASGPGDLVPQDPVRLFDTRTASSRVPVAAGATIRVPVVGKQGITSGAGTLAARIGVTGSARSGYLTVWSGTGIAPKTSAVTFAAAQTVGSLTAVQIAADGTIAVTNHSAGTAHVVVDSEGWWRSGNGTTGSLVDLSPRRLLDTRVDSPAIASHGTRVLDVLGPSGTDGHLHGVAAAVLTVTVAGPAAGGYLTVRSPADVGAPTTSSVNFAAGVTTSNSVLAPVDDDGHVSLYNSSAAATHVVVDITGYVTR
jgi:hypothetical protein